MSYLNGYMPFKNTDKSAGALSVFLLYRYYAGQTVSGFIHTSHYDKYIHPKIS